MRSKFEGTEGHLDLHLTVTENIEDVRESLHRFLEPAGSLKSVPGSQRDGCREKVIEAL